MNLIELTFNQFKNVRPLFIGSNHLVFTIDAVIAGNSPGRIWVDDLNEPSVGFLWDGYHCYYIAGTTSNTEFNTALKNLLLNKVIPKAIEKNREIFKLEYSPKEWEPILEVLLKKTLPIKSTRVFYAYKKQKISEWKDIPPNDFIIRKIDEQLLNSTIKNVDTIIDEINQCWNSIDDFLNNGFGFCLIHKPVNEETSVQGWCTGEFFSEGKCGIGIETFYTYQGRGFATAMTSAFVRHCLSVKIRPHWDAMANNHASIRVAEKVGFEKIQDYTVLFGSFTDVESFQGQHAYREGNFKTAAILFEKAAEIGDDKVRDYYNAACSWALINDVKRSITSLNKAIDNLEEPTIRFISYVRNARDFAKLHKYDDWKKILDRLRRLERQIMS